MTFTGYFRLTISLLLTGGYEYGYGEKIPQTVGGQFSTSDKEIEDLDPTGTPNETSYFTVPSIQDPENSSP